jgi:hypothetical protein
VLPTKAVRLYRHCVHVIKQQQRQWTGELGEAMQPISHWVAFLGLAALALPGPGASAQDDRDYPNRTVTIVAPSAPGGMYSILARLIGGKLDSMENPSLSRTVPARAR